MPILNLSINKKDYQIACNEGEEDHLARLAYELDKRVKEIARQVGNGNQSLLLALAGIMALDELYESRTGGAGGKEAAFNLEQEIESATAAAITDLAERVESMAMRLERES